MKRSKAYRAAAEKIEEGRLYGPREAIRLAKETASTKYDSTVEVGLDNPLEAKEENRPGVETYDIGDDAIVAWDPASTNVVKD